MRKGAVLISMMSAPSSPDYIADLAKRGITGMALDAVPRISRAQSMDVLSTMSNVAGYRAVIEAAENYGGMFTGQMTAAGKTPPANVFVIGAGVAGLSALGTAASLGAEVRAFDVRPEVGEQIESMGATFVQAEAAQQEVSSDGYAKARCRRNKRSPHRDHVRGGERQGRRGSSRPPSCAARLCAPSRPTWSRE